MKIGIWITAWIHYRWAGVFSKSTTAELSLPIDLLQVGHAPPVIGLISGLKECTTGINDE